MNWNGSPGYPWASEYATNRKLIEENYVEFVIAVVDMLELWRDTPLEKVRAMDGRQHCASRLFDPCRVFVKDEPHPLRKFVTKKMRLVISVSATVSVAMGVLHQRQNDAEIRNHATCPSKPGMSTTQQGIAQIWDFVQDGCKFGPVVSDDVAAWDWSVLLSLIDMETDFAVLLQRCKGTQWENMIRVAAYCLAASLLVLSDGRMFMLLQPGGVRSGGRKTASGNSHMRHLLSAMVQYLIKSNSIGHFAAAMGDDCVERLSGDIETFRRTYLQLGFTLTDLLGSSAGEPFEFCSHLFVDRETAIPTQWARSLYRLISKPYDRVEYFAWLDEMRHLSDSRAMIKLDHLVDFLTWVRWLPTPITAQKEFTPQAGFLYMSNQKKNKGAVRTQAKVLKELGLKGGPAIDKKRTPKAKVEGGGVTKQKSNTPNAMTRTYLHQFFARKDAARTAWALMVGNPFGDIAVPVPVSLTPGASPACPRMFRVKLTNFATANAAGFVYIGANGDAWSVNTSAVAGSAATPAYLYLGNSTAFGTRGYPVHWTISTYVGCPLQVTGSDSNSYPGSQVTLANGVTGLGFAQLPDGFITGQTDCSVGAANLIQRYSNVAVGLRARPTTAALAAQGTLVCYQQTVGDNYVTNPVYAAGTALPGGKNTYTYMQSVPEEEIGRLEMSIPDWPTDKWIGAAGLPNTYTSFGQWSPGNVGASIIGRPCVSIIGQGLSAGQVIEWEAEYIYAFYGSISYEPSALKNRQVASSPAEIGSILSSGAQHMGPSNQQSYRAPLKAVAQEAVDSGRTNKSGVGDWIKSGSNLIEEVTGSSIGELVGEGLGFLAALL
jgi:hypothetical protein